MLYRMVITTTLGPNTYQAGRIYTLPVLVARELVRGGRAIPLKRWDTKPHPGYEVKHAED